MAGRIFEDGLVDRDDFRNIGIFFDTDRVQAEMFEAGFSLVERQSMPAGLEDDERIISEYFARRNSFVEDSPSPETRIHENQLLDSDPAFLLGVMAGILARRTQEGEPK